MIRTLIGPAAWVIALVQGDYLSLSDYEAARCRAWLRREVTPGEAIIDAADVVWFTWSFPLYGGDCAGGEVTEYTVLAT